MLDYTSDWIEDLLEQPERLGSPDTLDVTMGCLIGIAAVNCKDQFDSLYREECIKVKGSASRGLLDLGTKEGWDWKPAKYSDQLPSYNRVSEGIKVAIDHLEQMKQLDESG